VRFDDDFARRLVESGLDSLVFGIDGATQETYSCYRKGGHIDVVKENIRALVRAKKKMGSRVPRVTLRFVAMRQNEGELDPAYQMAGELGVDSFAVKTVDMPPALGRNLDRLFAPGNQVYQRYAYEEEGFRRKRLPFTCMRPWKRITLDALGEIIPCEYDYRNAHSFGNLMSGRTALSLWKGKEALEFRRRFNKGHNDYYLCRNCTYKDRVAEDCTVALVELRGRKDTPAGVGLYYEQARSSRRK
jgi:radical SAM protein with 4Fe4S-binding SPASM domain